MKLQKGLEQLAPATDLDLDPGIRRAVLVLRSARIATFESCQGGPGHAFPDPTGFLEWKGGTLAIEINFRSGCTRIECIPPVHLRFSQPFGVF